MFDLSFFSFPCSPARPHRPYLHTSQRFSFLNGTFSGLTLYENVLSKEELTEIEDYVAKLPSLHFSDRTKDKLEKSPGMWVRLKFFFGFRYSYGSGSRGRSQLFNDVAAIPEEIDAALKRMCDRVPGIDRSFFNQAVSNIYRGPGSSLGVHRDDEALFARPIFSLRLLSDSRLSFNNTGLGKKQTRNHFSIPLPRGAFLRMEGLAADRCQHCVESRYIKSRSCSIIFRRAKWDENDAQGKT